MSGNRTVRLVRWKYRPSTPLREDIAHLINTNTMDRAEMLESGVTRRSGVELVYHDVRLYFPKPNG
jgi:hypothetical protein